MKFCSHQDSNNSDCDDPHDDFSNNPWQKRINDNSTSHNKIDVDDEYATTEEEIHPLHQKKQHSLVMLTAEDALKAKFATVQAKYYNDPYIPSFLDNTVKSQSTNSRFQSKSSHIHQRPQHVQVIIKRGTYARVMCIEHCIHTFLRIVQDESNTNTKADKYVAQIVILGSGYDTTPFRIQQQLENIKKTEQNSDNNDSKQIATRLLWLEIDHPEIIDEKVNIIRQRHKQNAHEPILPTILQSSTIAYQNDETGFDRSINNTISFVPSTIYNFTYSSSSKNYVRGHKEKFRNQDVLRMGSTISMINGKIDYNDNDNNTCWSHTLIGYDLRNDPVVLVQDLLMKQSGYDPSIPTLVVSECVQMYMPYDRTINLLQAFTTAASLETDTSGSELCFCCYEPILGRSTKDLFGKMMEQNFRRAGYIPNTEQDDEDDDDDCGNSSVLLKCRTVQDYGNLLKQTGFRTVYGCDMDTVYQTILPQSIRTHANNVEFLDELEEFQLIMKHYSFIVATTASTGIARVTNDVNSGSGNNKTDDYEQSRNISSIGRKLCKAIFGESHSSNIA